jgi:hypothetical protein
MQSNQQFFNGQQWFKVQSLPAGRQVQKSDSFPFWLYATTLFLFLPTLFSLSPVFFS